MSDVRHVGGADNTKRPRFWLSVETRAIYDRLQRSTIDETITYLELNEIAAIDVQAAGRGALNSARRMALRDDRFVFAVVSNIGLRRLSDHDIVASSSSTFVKVRHAARRGAERLTSVQDWSALTDADKVQHNATLSALRIVELMAKPKSIARLSGAVNSTNTGELPIARTLELFRGPSVAVATTDAKVRDDQTNG